MNLLFLLMLNGFFICGGVLERCLKTIDKCSIQTRRIRRQCKNKPIIIHSLAYGGRGIYIHGKTRARNSLNSNSNSNCFTLLLGLILVIVILLGITAAVLQLDYNATLGFPGEGPNGTRTSNWSANEPNLSMATWNARSLTFERFYYCKSLNYDILAITELWRTAHQFADGTTRWTHSKAKLNKFGKPKYPEDHAAGVGILLSERAQAKYLSHGSPSERITWVRLKGPVTNMFIIATYVPHRARANPAQHNTLEELQELLKQVHQNDCIIVLGDFNEQLPANIENHTGNWAFGKPSQNADAVIDIMRLFDLYAINTKFEPPTNSSNATFIAVKKKEDKNTKDVDLHGRKTRTILNGELCKGTVFAQRQVKEETQWMVNYPDGTCKSYTEDEIKDILIPKPAVFTYHQLDYVLVSNRWKSCINNAKVNWSPSIHRNRHGKTKTRHGRADHALVEITWKWRLRAITQRPTKAWSALKQPSVAASFQAATAKLIKEDDQLDTEQVFEQLNSNILTAAKTTIPDKVYVPTKARGISERTRLLFEKRSEATAQTTSPAQLQELQNDIKKSCLQDYTEWIDSNVQGMEAANEVGDTRKIYEIVRHLSKKAEQPKTNLTKDKQGNIIKDPKEVAGKWYDFLAEKFSATKEESTRDPLEQLPTERCAADSLTRKEFDDAINKMSDGKAVGPGGVPVEAYKYCPQLRDRLFKLIERIWTEERVPSNFAEAKFVMLFKNKGSPDDPSKYRCIGLLNHEYKVLTHIMLARMLMASDNALQDWQAGFRANRGCRDNSMILRTLCDTMLALGEKIAITFIDYSAAFDSVSHRFIDAALKQAKISTKIRAMYRAIYAVASAHTTVPAADGKQIKSDTFPIRRGVVQGDITSPLYFILALDLILKRHDNFPNKGVPLGAIILHTLGYADDAALLDFGDEEGIATASARITSIDQGSKKDADMVISVQKTKVLHVRQQEKTTATTSEEAIKVCKFECPHAHCDHKFLTKRGMQIHAGKCEYKDIYDIQKILDHRKPPSTREYLVRWLGYGPKDDSWVPRQNIHPMEVTAYEQTKGIYDFECKFRCRHCNRPFNTDRGRKIHEGRMHKFQIPEEPEKHVLGKERNQNFTHSLADSAVKLSKMKAAQKHRNLVQCSGGDLENVFLFKYLGTIFAADGQQDHDINRRIALALSRCGTLRHIFASTYLSRQLKLRLYKAAVCSIFTYGCETWDLSEQTMKKINGANSRMLSHITGRSARIEASSKTTSMNLVRQIRIRRFRWLGHILRTPTDRLIHVALEAQLLQDSPGNLFLDAPPFKDLDDLREQARDRAGWQGYIGNIPFDGKISKFQMQRQRTRTSRRKSTPLTTKKVTTKSTFRMKCKPCQMDQTEASKYRRRDAKMMLLTGKTKYNVKPKKTKAKTTRLTHKEKTAMHLKQYVENHPNSPATTMERKAWAAQLQQYQAKGIISPVKNLQVFLSANTGNKLKKDSPPPTTTSSPNPNQAIIDTTNALRAVFSDDSDSELSTMEEDSYYSILHETTTTYNDFIPASTATSIESQQQYQQQSPPQSPRACKSLLSLREHRPQSPTTTSKSEGLLLPIMV